MMPPSPAPLAPSGLFGDGCSSSETARSVRIVGRERHQVVGERGDQQLAVLVVGDLLGEDAAEPLHRRADHLPVQRLRIDDAADVVDHDVVEHLDTAGARIDRDMGDRGAVGVGRSSNCRTCRRPRARRAPPASRGGRPARWRRPRASVTVVGRDAEALAGGRAHLLDQRVRGLHDRAAAHHRGARAVGAVALRQIGRGAVIDRDPLDRHFERVGGDLRHDGLDPLPDADEPT